MLFAAAFLPEEIPHYWEIVAAFSSKHQSAKLAVTSETTRVLMENLLFLDSKLFSMDFTMTKELITMEYGYNK